MKENIILSIVILGILALSNCQRNDGYSIEINREMWKSEPIIPIPLFDQEHLNDGNLYIHFQTFFYQDTAVIKINNKLFGEYILTTFENEDLADVIIIPNFDYSQNVSVSINNGNEALFNIADTLNQVIVRFDKSKLFIGFRKHMSYYD